MDNTKSKTDKQQRINKVKQKLGLRRSKRFLVRDGVSKEDFPLVCKYYGIHPIQGNESVSAHLFLISGNLDAGYYVSDEELAEAVEPFTVERVREIERQAQAWLDAQGAIA
jgi:hypothetical protein